MRRRTKHWLTGLAAGAVVFALAAPEARACGVCSDLMVEMGIPGVSWVAWLPWAWLLAGRLVWEVWGGEGVPGAKTLLTPRELFRMGGLFAAIFVGGLILQMGVLVGQTLLYGLVWCVLILVRLSWAVAGVAKGQRAACAGLLLHGGFAAAAVVLLIVGNRVNGQSPSWLAERLVLPVAGQARARLLALGPQAVPGLAERVRTALSYRSDRFSQNYVMNPALDVLGDIGGPEASRVLRDLVRKEVTFASTPDAAAGWEAEACLAWARADGEGAADDLIALHQRLLAAKPPELAGADWVLAAIARTGSRRGTLYALDHFDEVGATAESSSLSGADAANARQTAGALLNGQTSDDLRQAQAKVFDPPWGRRRDAHDWAVSDPLTEWARRGDEVRRHWEAALPPAGETPAPQ